MALLDKLLNAIVLLRRSAVQWILNADFSDTQAAPIPRTCEPGPGTLTVVEKDGQYSISGGAGGDSRADCGR